jgi:hypothetical protein
MSPVDAPVAWDAPPIHPVCAFILHLQTLPAQQHLRNRSAAGLSDNRCCRRIRCNACTYHAGTQQPLVPSPTASGGTPARYRIPRVMRTPRSAVLVLLRSQARCGGREFAR